MTIHVQRRDGIVWVVGRGEVDLPEIRDVFQGVRDGASSGHSMRIVIQDEGTTFSPYTEELRELIGMFADMFADVDLRVAVIAGREVQYGVGRMFEARAEGAGFAARAFRPEEEDDAVRWLRDGSDAG